MEDASEHILLAQTVVPSAPGDDTISLTYSERLLRRKRLTTDQGESFLVDLEETRGLDEGDAFCLDDGRRVAVLAAVEDLAEVTGDLPRFAWHIGNRHTPCEIHPECLRIADDHVLVAMLRQLGANIRMIRAPFRPEGGAYGHGRTMGHDHGHHDHAHSH